MEDEKIMNFECRRFLGLIDKYIDGDLSRDDEAFFYAHAAACINCEKELKIADMMKTAMEEVDDDIVVPLNAQSAWRNAVRKEIRRKKNSRFVKMITSAAAAFAVLVGTTFVMRGTGALPPEYRSGNLNTNAAYKTAVTETASAKIMTARSMPSAGDFVIESDGETEAAFIGTDPAAVFEEEFIRSAQRVAETDDIENDKRLLYELTEEYEGRITEEYQNHSEGAGSVTVVSRIPVELMDEYLTALDNIGHTVFTDIVSEDASLVYYDLEARIETRQKSAERLNQLIQEAGGEELKELKNQLDSLYEEIDSLMSQSLQKENDISYARVTVVLNEVISSTAAEAANVEKSTLSERSSEGFKQSASAVGRFFEDMVVSIAVIAPVLVPVAALAVFVIAIMFAVRKKGKNKSEEKIE